MISINKYMEEQIDWGQLAQTAGGALKTAGQYWTQGAGRQMLGTAAQTAKDYWAKGQGQRLLQRGKENIQSQVVPYWKKNLPQMKQKVMQYAGPPRPATTTAPERVA